MRMNIVSISPIIGKTRWIDHSLTYVKRKIAYYEYENSAEIQVEYYNDRDTVPVKIEFWVKKAKQKRFRKTL